MTRLRLSGRLPTGGGAPLLVLPFLADPDGVVAGAGGADLSTAWGVDLQALARAVPSFTADPGSCLPLPVPAPGGSRVVLAVGLGPAASVTDARIRDAAQVAAVHADGYPELATTLPQVGADLPAAVRAVAEGLLLGCYRYRPGRAAPPASAALLVPPGQARRAPLLRALEFGRTAGEAACWVRRLVETPAGALTPGDLAEQVVAHARAAGVSTRVWGPRALAARGFGAVLGVGAGSRNPPRVVELRCGEGPAGAAWGLAGKGITFDSGGLNLKQDAHEISWMKSDMAAAAAVAAAVTSAAALGAAAPTVALLPLAENMPGGGALRPGDVVTHPDGRTTEVTDTDCEGRLVLADALAYLAKSRPAALLDVGTLTDGGGVGDALWGCWATGRELAAQLLAAGEAAGEPGWELPLRPEYARLLDSDVADAVNSASDVPDSGQLAATYLRPFAAGVPWVHVDNGSSAYLEQARSPWPKGATGSPTRALLELLLRRG